MTQCKKAVAPSSNMITFLFTITFAAVVCASPLTSYPRGRLLGSIIQIEEAPYQVTIHCKGLPTCSGAFISSDHILTAAHCVVDYADCRVRVGSSLRNSQGNLRAVKDIKVHEGYDQETYPWKGKRDVPANDLAILKLGNWLPDVNKLYRPIGMFNETEIVDAGVDATITGWSKLSDGSDEHLTSRNVQILDVGLCDKAYESVGGVPAGQICAAYPGAMGKGGCQGDSGAPLVVEGRLAGILSWGNGCVKPYYPGLYTEVAYYRDWIDEKIQS